MIQASQQENRNLSEQLTNMQQELMNINKNKDQLSQVCVVNTVIIDILLELWFEST